MEGKSIRTKEEKVRNVMETLSGSSSIAEVCRRYNVASSAFYKVKDAFIAGGTASVEAGKSSKEVQMQKEIDDISRFPSKEEFSSYCGLVPRQDQSGDNDIRWHMSKRGLSMLRFILVTASHIAIKKKENEVKISEHSEEGWKE